MKESKSKLVKQVKSLKEGRAEKFLLGKNKKLWEKVFFIYGRHRSDYDAEQPFGK